MTLLAPRPPISRFAIGEQAPFIWVKSRCRHLQTLADAFIAECGPWSSIPRLTVTVGGKFPTKLYLGPPTCLRNRCVQDDRSLIQ